MARKETVKFFWWLHNTDCWKIKRQGFVDMFLYLPTMKYLYKDSINKIWHGTKNPHPLIMLSREDQKKVKRFNTEQDALEWFSKKGR